MSQTDNPSNLDTGLRHRKIESLFEAAISLSPNENLSAWLRRECGEDSSLFTEVLGLLEADARASGFMKEREPAASTQGANTPNDSQGGAHFSTGSAIGPYKILKPIGEGGFGVVYLAEQTEPVSRSVALKIIKADMNSRETLARFETERQALALMDHPNIAKVIDAGNTPDGRPYFVMELVSGLPITSYCDEHNLSTQERLQLFQAVCGAIHHAHLKGIIHRDIKPSNVLVTTYDGTPTVKVIDFGIAKALRAKLSKDTIHTCIEQFIGTPAYMSPEQADSSIADIDTRSDIYSLGVLLYELLIGRAPFDISAWRYDGYDEIRRRIREVDPLRPSIRLSELAESDQDIIARHRATAPEKLQKQVKGDLDWIVMKALEKDRNRRYASAGLFAHDVENFLRHEAVDARPPSLSYKVSKFIRRRRATCLVVGISATSIILGLVTSLYGLAEAKKGWREADKEAAKAKRLLYPNTLNAAAEAIRNGQRARAIDLLELCPVEERGWEWQWIHKALEEPILTLAPTNSPARPSIQHIHWNPESTQLFSIDALGFVNSWHTDSTSLSMRKKVHESLGRQLALTEDASQVLSIADGHQWKRIDASNGEVLQFADRNAPFEQVALSKNGAAYVTADARGRVALWTPQSATPLALMDDSVFDINALAIHETSGKIAAGTRLGAVFVWNFSGDRLFEKPPTGQRLTSIQFASDGTSLATGSDSGTIEVWRIEPGREISSWKAHTRGVVNLAFNVDDTTLASSGEESGIGVWDPQTGDELGYLIAPSQQTTLNFSNDMRYLASAGLDGSISVWDLNALSPPIIYHGPQTLILDASATPDGSAFATASSDGRLSLWDTDSGLELARLNPTGDAMRSVQFHPTGRTMATLGQKAILRILDTREFSLLREFPIHSRVKCLKYDSKGEQLATGSLRHGAQDVDQAPMIAIWNIERGEPLRELPVDEGEVVAIDFNHDDRRLVAAVNSMEPSPKGHAIIWNLDDGQLLRRLELPTPSTIRSLLWNKISNQIYTGYADGRVAYWDGETGELQRILNAHGEEVGALQLTSDGQRLATAAWYSPEIKYWNAATGEPLLSQTTRLKGISSLILPANREAVIASGLDGEIQRLNAATDNSIGFSQLRALQSQSLRALVEENESLIEVVTGPEFQRHIDVLVDRRVQLWRNIDREHNFPLGANLLASAIVAEIGTRYFESLLFEEAVLAFEKCIDLAPSRNFQEQLLWISETEWALENGRFQYSIDDWAPYLGVYQTREVCFHEGRPILRNLNNDLEWSLIPVGSDEFLLMGNESARIQFASDPNSPNAHTLVERHFSGSADRYSRGPMSATTRWPTVP